MTFAKLVNYKPSWLRGTSVTSVVTGNQCRSFVRARGKIIQHYCYFVLFYMQNLLNNLISDLKFGSSKTCVPGFIKTDVFLIGIRYFWKIATTSK